MGVDAEDNSTRGQDRGCRDENDGRYERTSQAQPSITPRAGMPTLARIRNLAIVVVAVNPTSADTQSQFLLRPMRPSAS
jgi:hypothetical protein